MHAKIFRMESIEDKIANFQHLIDYNNGNDIGFIAFSSLSKKDLILLNVSNSSLFITFLFKSSLVLTSKVFIVFLSIEIHTFSSCLIK